MKIRDILHTKGSSVITVTQDAGITAAVELLVQHDIGALVVIEGAEIAGIITERDMLRAINEGAAEFGELHVRDIMTRDVITGTPEAAVDDVMHVMTEQRIRHLPVVEGGALLGLISIGDVVNAMRREAQAENQQLHAYITGMPL
jgi:CBS domain-containing protein